MCVGLCTQRNDMAVSSNGSPQSSIDPHAYCRLRFDEAAEEAIENLANVLQWHRNSQHEGMFVAQKDGRAGASSRKLSSSSSFLLLSIFVVASAKFVSKFISGILESRRAITVGVDDDDFARVLRPFCWRNVVSRTRGVVFFARRRREPSSFFLSFSNTNGRVMSWS